MNRAMLLDHLELTERHIRDGERHIARQREIVAELERHGRGQSETAQVAREILQSMEIAQSAHIADHERLTKALQAIT